MERILQEAKKIIPKPVFRFFQPVYHFLLSWAAAFFYRFPSKELVVIGVTGTTGKTTSVYLIAKMLENAGWRVGFTSTAIFNDGKSEWLNDKKMTMVGRFFTQKMLRRMVKNNCQYAIVETTSEGVAQFRHFFINYDILVFTGLYPEHIESHGSFENYKNTKGKLFAHLKRCGVKYVDDKKNVKNTISGMKKIELNRVKKIIIANGDDEHAEFFSSFWAEDKIIYTRKNLAFQTNFKVLHYGNIELKATGTSLEVENTKINMQLLGEFNATNAMNAVGVGISQGLALSTIKTGLEAIEGVAGRLEQINERQDYTVIVDYAFEPGAVKKLYCTIKLIPHNKVIHVLGSAGGGRDASRRRVLGDIAGRNADIVIVTNEDPYDDDPGQIADEVLLGAAGAGKTKDKDLYRIMDRREAIKKAINFAKEKDLILITGKGCEQAICVKNGKTIPWDDRAIVRGIINGKINLPKKKK